MKASLNSHRSAAFTLTEVMIAAVITAIIGVAAFSVLSTGTMLSARNFSVNLTNNSERNALDRAEELIQQAYTMPTLIDTSGNAATGSAAGITFDYYLGGPYVVTVSGSSLLATVTSLGLTRTTNSVALDPLPAVGDVLQFDSGTSTVRALVSSVTAGTPDASQHQAITVNLASALGTAVTVPTSGILTAHLVRKVALIVMPAGASNQLRYYGSYEMTTNLSDPTKYVVLTKEIANQSGDATPFSLTQLQAANFVSLSLRVRSSAFDQRLAGKQGDQFNTYSRIDSFIRPKMNPQ